MAQTLVERLAPRLKELNRGGYSRTYRRAGRSYDSSLKLALAEILDSLGIEHKESASVPGTSLKADFEANGVFLFVDRKLSDTESRRLAASKSRVVLVKMSPERSTIAFVWLQPRRRESAR